MGLFYVILEADLQLMGNENRKGEEEKWKIW